MGQSTSAGAWRSKIDAETGSPGRPVLIWNLFASQLRNVRVSSSGGQLDGLGFELEIWLRTGVELSLFVEANDLRDADSHADS